jgi:hypothetical protein
VEPGDKAVEVPEPGLSCTTIWGTKKQTWFAVKTEHQTQAVGVVEALQLQVLVQEGIQGITLEIR